MKWTLLKTSSHDQVFQDHGECSIVLSRALPQYAKEVLATIMGEARVG